MQPFLPAPQGADSTDDASRDLEASPTQVAALRHPSRNRILLALREEATLSQLAARLRMNKGNVAHHLRVLADVGLVEVRRTRTVRGGTERYWIRTAERLRTPGGPRGHTAALLAAVAEDIDSSPTEPLLHLRRVRLTPHQAAALRNHLDDFLARLPDGPRDAPTYGVMVTVYGTGS